MTARIIDVHALPHSCRRHLRHMIHAMNGNILAGSVAECVCGQLYMFVTEKPWWRRGWPIGDDAGWWIVEPRRLRRQRSQDGLQIGLEDLIEQEAGKL